MNKNPICTILWQDAAYTFEEKMPIEPPLPQLTAGFIIKSDDEKTFIATNVKYDSKSRSLKPIDGLIIPEKSIIKFQAHDFYDAKEN